MCPVRDPPGWSDLSSHLNWKLLHLSDAWFGLRALVTPYRRHAFTVTTARPSSFDCTSMIYEHGQCFKIFSLASRFTPASRAFVWTRGFSPSSVLHTSGMLRDWFGFLFRALAVPPARRVASRQRPQLSWGYGPFRSILERDAITRTGYVNPLRPFKAVRSSRRAQPKAIHLWQILP